MTHHKSSTERADQSSKICRNALHNLDIHDLDTKKCVVISQPRLHIHDLGEVDKDNDYFIFILD